MTAKTPAERKREQRERDKLREEERLARLLARTIKVDLYKATDYALVRCMVRAGIEEPQDMISRLIHGADRLDDAELAALVSLPGVSREAVTNEEQKEITCASEASAAESRLHQRNAQNAEMTSNLMNTTALEKRKMAERRGASHAQTASSAKRESVNTRQPQKESGI